MSSLVERMNGIVVRTNQLINHQVNLKNGKAILQYPVVARYAYLALEEILVLLNKIADEQCVSSENVINKHFQVTSIINNIKRLAEQGNPEYPELEFNRIVQGEMEYARFERATEQQDEADSFN